MTEPTPAPISEAREPLVAALIELERHVAAAGWDQPPRLFALVSTDALIAAEPQLASHLGLAATEQGGIPGALSGIEQDHFEPGEDVIAALAQIVWPATVEGCVISLERGFLPPSAEADIPEDPAAAAAFVAGHPSRQDVRVLVGAVREPGPAGAILTHGVARLVSHPEDLLAGEDLVPGLAQAVARSLG